MSVQEVEDKEIKGLPNELYENPLVKPEETFPETQVALIEKTKPQLRKGEHYEGKIISRNPRGYLIVDYNGDRVTLYDPEESNLFPPSFAPSLSVYKPGMIVVFELTSHPGRGALWGKLLYKKKQ